MKKQPNFFLRSVDGQVIEVPAKFKYLEIRTLDDFVTHVFAVEDGHTIMFTKEDPEAAKYQGAYKDVKFGQVVTMDQINEEMQSNSV